MNPYAPITPEQEKELVMLLAAGRGRQTQDRLRKQLRGVSADEAARTIRKLRGEPEPPFIPVPAANPAATRAANAAARERLDAGYAGHAMQQLEQGLSQPSLYAGFNGQPYSMTR